MFKQRQATLSAFALLVIATTVQVTNAGRRTRIVGGTRAETGEFPFMVSLRTPENVHFCGGAIINKRVVVTAAHCILRNMVYPFENFTVVTGSTALDGGGAAWSVSDAIAHEGFDYWADVSQNDIGIIKLASDIEFDDHTSAIKLPKAATPGDVQAVVAGWGHFTQTSGKFSSYLNKAAMKTVDPARCQSLLIGSEISQTQICAFNASGIGTCHGDSGGPLVAGDVIAGVSSYNLPCARGQPDVYTAVYYYLDWIKENTK